MARPICETRTSWCSTRLPEPPTPPTRSTPAPKAATIKPDRIHQALAEFVKAEASGLDEKQQGRALDIAKIVLAGRSISPNQELSLYRDAVRLAKLDWNPKMSASQLRAALVKELNINPWNINPSIVAIIADAEFGIRPSTPEIHDLAMRCSSREEVRQDFLAKGLTPVKKPQP